MEWVAIDVHIAGDAVTHRLAGLFRLRVAEAAGLLALAFAGMAQHAQAGELADVADSQLETWALWHGKRGAFAAFFREHLCDEAGTVRAWEKYNGANIREAKASRARMLEYRAKKKAERKAFANPNGTAYPTPNGTANGTPHVTRSVRLQQDMTGQNRTTNSNRVVASAATDPEAETPDVAVVLAHYRERHPKRRPGAKEAKLVASSLRLGYSAADLCEAIDGNATDTWHVSKVKHELGYVLRDAGNIDNFRAMLESSTAPLVDADGILNERGAALFTGPAR
jgi:hypothetical protein